MNEEKKNIIKILRSLIISSPQKGKSLRDLVRDYREFAGTKIPIYEYRSVEDFLRGTGEFIIENFRGELIIYEKPNPNSEHIVNLVADQKKTSKRRAAPVPNRFRPILRSSNAPRQNTAYSSNNSFRSPTKTIFPRRCNNVSNAPRIFPLNQRSQPQTMEFSIDQLKSQQTDNNNVQNRLVNGGSSQPSSADNSAFNARNQSTQSSVDLRNRINEIREKQATVLVDLTQDDSDDSKTSRNSPLANPQNNQFVKKSPPITPRKSESKTTPNQHQNSTQQVSAPTSAKTTSTVQQQPLLANNPFFDFSQPPPSIQTGRMQDRLKNQPKYDSHSIVNANVVVTGERKSMNLRLVNARQAVANVNTTPPELPVTPVTQSSPTIQSHEKDLLDYCKENQLSLPIFKIFKVNKSFQCHVTIDKIRYSSYPTEYSNQNEARLETAKHALERLIAAKNQLKYDVCLDNEVDLAIKIYECIKDCPTGVFSKKIPELFLSLYEQVLPSDWMNALAKHPKCFTIEDCINDQIVYVVEAAELDQKMDKLELPWDTEYWCLVITCTVSTAEIWGRIIGKDHSNALDSLVTDIELELMKNKQIPETFNVGQIYLILINECAYRVRVEKVDETRRHCLCFSVDEGDYRWCDMNEMYVCQNKFLKLAPQAIRFALHGLEEFDENEFAKKHLEETLLSAPPLVGQIFTRKEDYIAQEESDDLEPVIQVVLYDTSTDDDINLHPVIVEKICADIPAPKLPHLNLTPVIVSHIADNGDIYCQLQQNGVHYVNKLIHKLTNPDAQIRPQTLPTINTSNKNLYLVFDEDIHKWCRGTIIKEGKQEHTMFFVDYGKTKVTPLSKIYRLESLSQALLTFPPQAIQVKLSGFDQFPQHLVSTLRGYFSDINAYVSKTNASSVIPEVLLYFAKDSCIVCVNDCLNSELERQQVSDTPFSRQSSTTSNTSRDSKVQEELSNFDNLTISGRKLPKFQPPEVSDYFDVEVVMTATPDNFKIRPRKYMPQWKQQMNSLQEYCNKNRDTMKLNMIREGEAYACLHCDGSWYRAIVERRSDSKILVFFCDNGEIECIDDVEKLKVLPEMYRGLPKLAINAKLFGIKPKYGDWEMDDIMAFNALVSGKAFQAIVGKIVEKADNADDNAELEIQLIDVSMKDDECINDTFVRCGRAESIFLH